MQLISDKQMEASDWAKRSVTKARYAHVSEKEIFIVFQKKVGTGNTSTIVEYAERYPNDNLIQISVLQKTDKQVRTYFINEDLVRYIKDIFSIHHWPHNNNDRSKEQGVNCDTLILMTRKGRIKQSNLTLNGKRLNNSDAEALYK